MKNFNTLQSFCLLLMFLMSAMSAEAHYDFKEDNVYYRIIDNVGLKVSVVNNGEIDGFNGCYSGEVTIPATVTFDNKTYSVKAIQDSAFVLDKNHLARGARVNRYTCFRNMRKTKRNHHS